MLWGGHSRTGQDASNPKSRAFRADPRNFLHGHEAELDQSPIESQSTPESIAMTPSYSLRRRGVCAMEIIGGITFPRWSCRAGCFMKGAAVERQKGQHKVG